MENNLINNIRFLRKKHQLTQDEMASALGVKRAVIGSYEEGRAVPKITILQKICTHFKISIDELINSDLSNSSTITDKITGKNLRILSTVVNQENNELVSIVPQKASAGYLNGYSDPEYIETLPSFSMPFPELSKERTYRVFQIKGDSMFPVPPGSYIFCEYILDWTDIKDGKAHILITFDEGIVYKRIYNRINESQNLLLKSDNPEYEPYTVPIQSILEVWKALGYLTFDLQDSSGLNIQQLKNMIFEMQEEITRIKDSF